MERNLVQMFNFSRVWVYMVFKHNMATITAFTAVLTAFQPQQEKASE